MKRVIPVLLTAALAALSCKASKDPDGASKGVNVEADVRAGFDELLSIAETCDAGRFLEAHTQKARGAMEALDKVVDLAELGLDPQGDHPGARWTCALGRLAGFRKDAVQVIQLRVNAKLGTARIVFTLRDREYGFPMMRQFGKWRAPFPGFVFLASEYRDWQKTIEKTLPDPSRWPDLASRLGRAATMLEPFQPNWAEFPDLAPTEE